MTGALKPAPHGFWGHLPPTDYLPAYGGLWVTLPWAACELALGHYDFTLVEAGKQQATAAGLKHIRIRPMAGMYTPDFYKQQFGSYAAVDPVSGSSTSHPVVCWWERGFPGPYARWMAALAHHVEGDPMVLEVAASMTMSIFAEPMIRQIASTTTVAAMRAAGYTAALDQSAQVEMMRVMNATFTHTRVGLACSPWQDAESRVTLLSWTQQFMADCRAELGHKLILENNSLDGVDAVSDSYRAMYDAQRLLGGPLAYQTHAYPRLTDPAGAVAYALELGASALEPASVRTLTSGWTAAEALAASLQLQARRLPSHA